MKYRNPKKEADLFSMLDHRREVAGTVKGINKLNEFIDWELFRKELESLPGYDQRDGRKSRSASF